MTALALPAKFTPMHIVIGVAALAGFTDPNR
jgi:hypothetical protein